MHAAAANERWSLSPFPESSLCQFLLLSEVISSVRFWSVGIDGGGIRSDETDWIGPGRAPRAAPPHPDHPLLQAPRTSWISRTVHHVYHITWIWFSSSYFLISNWLSSMCGSVEVSEGQAADGQGCPPRYSTSLFWYFPCLLKFTMSSNVACLDHQPVIDVLCPWHQFDGLRLIFISAFYSFDCIGRWS